MSEAPDASPAEDPLAALRTEPPPRPWGNALDVVTSWPASIQAAVALAAIAAIAVLSFTTFASGESSPPELSMPVASAVPQSTQADAAPSSVAATTALVHAAGAVLRPGLYELPVGSRIDDVLEAAGGATPEADLDRLNLAATVADGERVWVPRRGEAEPPAVVGGGGGPSEQGKSEGDAETTGPIDLNRATAEELDTLPGVGPATADAIIAHREANGPFTSVDQLIDVRGIGEAKLAQLRDLVRV